jgi:hypothetical protein
VELVVSDVCAQCGAALEQHTGKGRPSRSCDPYCRRLAEYELRRIMRRLSLADADVDEHDRHARGLGYYYGDREKAAEKFAAAMERKAELESELAGLLARHEGKQDDRRLA